MASTSEIDFYVTGGTLRPDTPSYVERRADRELYDGLSRGEFCYVLTSRQMGKSSLMVHTAARLREAGTRVVVLDLTAIGQNLSSEQWYGGLLRRVGLQLDPSGDLEEELDDLWFEQQERVGPLERWMAAVRQVVLPRYSGEIAIFIDEIDAVRSLPFSTDEFFAAIRECYNRRAEDPEFSRLTFCLLGVAAPSDLIQDVRTTPFNIGRRIELTDFTEAEAAPLAAGLLPTAIHEEHEGHEELKEDGQEVQGDPRRPHHSSLITHHSSLLLSRILYWTGGHPYLTQRLCQAVAAETIGNPKSKIQNPKSDVDRLCAGLFLTARAQEQDDNLLFVRERLLSSEADRASLLDLYGQVRRGKRVPADETNPLVSILRLSGITRVVKSRSPGPLPRSPAAAPDLAVRNRIYERVFDPAWVAGQMPDAERRRQEAAYRRGLLRAGTLAAVIVTLMTGLTASSVILARRWRAATEGERRARVEAVRLLALDQTERGVRQLEAGNGLGLLDLVQARQNAEEIPDLKEAIATVWAGWHQAYAGRLISAVGHDGAVRALAFSPDGTRLATASEDKSVRLWDTRTWEPAAPPLPHDSAASVVAFSPNGKLLATAAGNRVWLWDAATGRPRGEPLQHNDLVMSVAFRVDGKLLASGSWDGTVRLWDTETGRPRGRPLRQHDNLESIGFGPPPENPLVSVNEHGVSIWNATTAALRGQLGHASEYQTLAFSRDGAVRAIAMDSAVWLWDTAQRRFRGVPLAHPVVANHLALSPDGCLLATAGDQEPAVQLWETATGQRPVPPLAHPAGVDALAFGPPGSHLLLTLSRGTVRFWDTSTGRPYPEPPPTPEGVKAMTLSPDGRILATVAAKGTVHLWSVATPPPYRRLPLQSPTVSIAFREDDPVLETYSGDGLRLWAADTGQLLSRPAGVPGEQSGGTFSEDGKLLAIWKNKSVSLWQTSTGLPYGRLPRSPERVHYAALSRHGAVLATISRYDEVQLWDTRSGRPRGAPLRHSPSVARLECSPDERLLATAGGDSVRLWETSTGRLRVPPIRLAGRPRWIAFSPDCRLLAVATSAGGAVTLRSTSTGRPYLHPLEHPAPVSLAAFSPVGSLLATVTDENVMRLWDLASGRPLGPPMPQPYAVDRVQFSPDGKRLATVSQGGARLWDAATGELVSRPLLTRERTGDVQFGLKGSVLALRTDRTAYLWHVPTAPAGLPAMLRLTALALGVAPRADGSAESLPWQAWRRLRGDSLGFDRGDTGGK